MVKGMAARPDGAAFSRTILKKVYDHEMMNDGSLFIFDPRHSLGEFTGVLENGGVVPNVARNQLVKIAAAAGMGAIDPAAASIQGTMARFFSANPSADNTRSKLERTSKKGLHIAMSQTTGAANSYSNIRLPTTAKSYVDQILPSSGAGANPIGFVMYRRITKPQVAIGSGLEGPSAMSWLQTSSNILMSDNGNSAGVGNATNGGSQRSPAASVAAGVSQFIGMVASGWTTSEQTGITPGIGPMPPDAFQSFNVNKAPSEIIYYCHLCDLTLAGTTATAWLAKEYAKYQALCETAGGAFYETTVDTDWTNPATLCP